MQRTNEELKKAFRVEIKDFEIKFNEACSFNPLDEMREKKISDLAISLRKLVVDSKNMKSLFSLMNISNDLLFKPICTFSKNDFAGNIMPVYPLIDAKFRDGHHYCRASFAKVESNLRFGLEAWLNEIVIDPKDDKNYKPTRLDVIRIIADKEGGAHYDGKHAPMYYEIVNNYAYEIVTNNGIIELENNCFFETMLSIACEFLNAINEYCQMKTMIKKQICYSSLYCIETSYRYESDLSKHSHNKYVHSHNYTPTQCFAFAFDTNGKASYRLIKTNSVLYFDVVQNKIIDYCILDYNNTLDLVMLWDIGSSGTKPYMLIRNNNKYSIISTYNDIINLNSNKKYSLSQAIRFISKGDIRIFDYSLSRQYVLEDENK